METTLKPVIGIDKDACINCYACIASCPVKFCMDNSGDVLEINQNLCIGCGSCVGACAQKARYIIDDAPAFFEKAGRENAIAIVAPAVASVFPGKYLNLNGWLKSLGVTAVFDVSFGAELTARSYINHIRNAKPQMVISQACPAIVTYVQIYQPELLPSLAPADSPMLHTLKMIREFFPKYKDFKKVVLSPCVAKRREFDETGLGDYNITFSSIKKYIDEKSINLDTFEEVPYDGPGAERAVNFPAPGGLLETAERDMPEIRRKTRKLEGSSVIYTYLTQLSQAKGRGLNRLPLLVDCLSCEKGCNGGPGTGNSGVLIDELEQPLADRRDAIEKLDRKGAYRKQLVKDLDACWKQGLYKRNYRNLSDNNRIKTPSEAELLMTYRSMHKISKKDFLNCGSCGYGDCKMMAIAIFNGLNRPEVCVHFDQKTKVDRLAQLEEVNGEMKHQIERSMNVVKRIYDMVKDLDSKVIQESDSVDASSVLVRKMVDSLHRTSAASSRKLEDIEELVSTINHGQTSMTETINAVNGIAKAVNGITQAIKIISAIAANTSILSMNAAIEAAHAGQAGAGFAVVADEIRSLSESTGKNSGNISQMLSGIVDGINVTSSRSNETNEVILSMAEEAENFAEIMRSMIGTVDELSSETEAITRNMNELQGISAEVKNNYDDMLHIIKDLRQSIYDLTWMSAGAEKTDETQNTQEA